MKWGGDSKMRILYVCMMLLSVSLVASEANPEEHEPPTVRSWLDHKALEKREMRELCSQYAELKETNVYALEKLEDQMDRGRIEVSITTNDFAITKRVGENDRLAEAIDEAFARMIVERDYKDVLDREKLKEVLLYQFKASRDDPEIYIPKEAHGLVPGAAKLLLENPQKFTELERQLKSKGEAFVILCDDFRSNKDKLANLEVGDVLTISGRATTIVAGTWLSVPLCQVHLAKCDYHIEKRQPSDQK